MNIPNIDIFCHVIDNFGDAGVVYRFAREFKSRYPATRVRVFIDSLKTLSCIEPRIKSTLLRQNVGQIEYIDTSGLDSALMEQVGIADLVVEAFACEIPEIYMEKSYTSAKLLINLEYISAEPWVDGYHLKESLLPRGTLKKFFFMPGFTTDTGGVIVERKCGLVKNDDRARFLAELSRTYEIEIPETSDTLFGTIFTYQRGFDQLLGDLSDLGKKACFLVFGAKSRSGMSESLEKLGALKVSETQYTLENLDVIMMPFLRQSDYDRLLSAADFNFVRGEDSLARAILASKPFVWNAYLQDGKYQVVKVDALMSRLKPYFDDSEVFEGFRDLHVRYNDIAGEGSGMNSTEQYSRFFADLSKINLSIGRMSYFMRHHCDLIDNFVEFVGSYQA